MAQECFQKAFWSEQLANSYVSYALINDDHWAATVCQALCYLSCSHHEVITVLIPILWLINLRLLEIKWLGQHQQSFLKWKSPWSQTNPVWTWVLFFSFSSVKGELMSCREVLIKMYVTPKVPTEWGSEAREPVRKLLWTSGLKGWGPDWDESDKCFQGKTKPNPWKEWWEIECGQGGESWKAQTKGFSETGGAMVNVEKRGYWERTVYLVVHVLWWGSEKGSSFIHSTNMCKLRSWREQCFRARWPEFPYQFCYFLLCIGPID